MAKRFIDTGFYKSPFVRSLKGPLKALYSFIICDCTGAGIWMKDLEVAAIYTGFQYTEEDWTIFVQSGRAVEVAPSKFFFPDFIAHQYPTGLSAKNAAHKNFLEELLKYSVLQECEDGAYKPLERSFEGSKVMVMVKEEVKVMVKETAISKNETREVSKGKPSTIDEVLAYFTDLGRPDQAQEFFDYFSSNGWKVGGKAPMKDWQAAARRWVRNSKPLAGTGQDRIVFGKTTAADLTAQIERLKKIDEQNKHQ